jgi:hypothetical protein
MSPIWVKAWGKFPRFLIRPLYSLNELPIPRFIYQGAEWNPGERGMSITRYLNTGDRVEHTEELSKRLFVGERGVIFQKLIFDFDRAVCQHREDLVVFARCTEEWVRNTRCASLCPRSSGWLARSPCRSASYS